MTMAKELEKFRGELQTAGMLEEWIEAVELVDLHEEMRLSPEYFERILAGGGNGGPNA